MKTKLIIGIVIGGAAALTALYISKKKKYAEVKTEETSGEDDYKNTIQFKKPTMAYRIKRKINRAARRIADWIIDHENDIQGLTKFIVMLSACFDLKNKAMKGRKAVIKKPKKTKNIADKEMKADDVFTYVENNKKTTRVIRLTDNYRFDIKPVGVTK